MLPFLFVVICTDDHSRRVSVLDPIHDAQQDAVVRLVDRVGTVGGTLTKLPGPCASVTVPHTWYHEQTPERVHLVSDSAPFGYAKKL